MVERGVIPPLFGRLVCCICCLLPLTRVRAGSNDAPSPEKPPGDKSRYNLFHPVPASEMRDFNPDRPTQADSAVTVDAGHIQIETNLADYTFDIHNPQRARVRVDQWNVFSPVVRIGVLDRAEFQLQYDGYLNVRTRDRSAKPTQVEATSGVGDLSLASKINLWGNEGGKTALAIFPVLKIPTDSAGLGNRSVEGHVGVPFDAELPAGFKLNVEPEFGFIRNDADTRYVAQFIDIITLTHDLGIKDLSGYVEFASEVDAERGTPVTGQVDVGLIYQIGNNFEIDGGCNIGVTRAAPDYEPFTGFSVRF